MAEIIGPDKLLADLQLQLSKTNDPAKRASLLEQISARQVEITKQLGGSAGFGGMGYIVPGSVEGLKGKTVLAPSFAEGVYSAVKYDPVTGAPIDITLQKTSDPAAKGTDRYDPNATNLRTYYDAQGNPISPAKLAQTLEGKNMAKAGWDIGYGPGKIGPGPTDFASGYVPPGTNDGTDTGGNRFFSTDGSGGSTAANNALIAQMKADLKERQSAFDVLYAEMDALGLAALVEPLRGLIQRDVSPSEFAVELRQSEAYKMRFAANEARLKKGLRVLSPGEYLRVEDAYRQTLRTYGLKQFDNDQYVRQFIENDISAAELSDRVATAVQRVQNADPAISRTLRDYYGIGQTDLVAYVLDPNQQLQKIQRQVAAAEIGVAARKQGLEAGVTVAEQLAAQGITQAEAQRGYATIADILPTSEKLSQIYGTTLEGYDQAQAEQEVFNQLASAQRKRQRLVGREIAEFSGQSGVARGSLGTATGGQY